MANPPITIGPFANVPAPGSPIKSDWPQQLTTHVVNELSLPNIIGALSSSYGKLAIKAAQASVGTNASGDAQFGFPVGPGAFTNPPIVIPVVMNPPASGLVVGIYGVTTGLFWAHATIPNTGAAYASQSLTLAYLAIARR